jgi:dipeptidyl aminopeptidase/acylaminoacyl peptidase
MRFVLLLATLLAPLVPAQSESNVVPVRQIGTARLEHVPEIPASVSAAVQRYQNDRAAVFEDWLADGSILIATRFGASQQIHRVAAPGGARTQLTFYTEPVAQAWTIPGSQRFVLSRDTGGDEWFQLYAMGLTGDAAQLTEAGTRNQSPVLSKDGKLMLWSRASKGSSEYEIMAANPYETGGSRVVHRASGSIEPSDIAADGSRALLTRMFSSRESQLWLLDLRTGQAKLLTSEKARAFYADPKFIRDGRAVLAISNKGSDVRRLLEIDLESGKESVVTPDLKWNVERFDLSDDGRVLAYALNEDGYSRVVVSDFVTRRALPQPDAPRGVITGLGFSPDGSQLAMSFSAAKTAGDVWVWSVRDGNLVRWTNSELGGLAAERLIEPRLVRFKSFDGLSVPAFVYRPVGAAPDARTPVIIDIHGGPESQSRPQWNAGAQYFAATLGATVILPNVRGSDGYGQRYMDLDNAEKREDSVKDIGALLDWIKTQPGLDASRVAVYGQSYGGYMSLAVMTHYADRLVGGVERYGISDFATFLTNTESYRRDNRRAEYGDERDPKMMAVFKRISPLANVAKITKPMLVLQGANDPRVPKSESDQVVAGIRKNGVESWYVVFADEGHGFQKKPNNDLRREVETVFLARLFGAPLS